MNDEQKDAILTEIENRHGIIGAICQEDGSDTHETLWYLMGRHPGESLVIGVALVDEIPHIVMSKKSLLDADLREWAAAMALEVDDD